MKCGDVNTKILSMLFFCFLVVALVSGCSVTLKHHSLDVPSQQYSDQIGTSGDKVEAAAAILQNIRYAGRDGIYSSRIFHQQG